MRMEIAKTWAVGAIGSAYNCCAHLFIMGAAATAATTARANAETIGNPESALAAEHGLNCPVAILQLNQSSANRLHTAWAARSWLQSAKILRLIDGNNLRIDNAIAFSRLVKCAQGWGLAHAI